MPLAVWYKGLLKNKLVPEQTEGKILNIKDEKHKRVIKL